MMPRIDTWRGRDAHQGLAEGLGSWRVGDRYYLARGVVIPWFDGDRLALVKIRQPEGRKPKYAEAYRDRPRVYPDPAVIEPGRPLIIGRGSLMPSCSVRSSATWPPS